MAMLPLQPITSKNAFYFSLAFHLIILTILVVSFDFGTARPVIENSNNKEIINAMVMDTPQKPTKILQKAVPPPPSVLPKPVVPKPPASQLNSPAPTVKPIAKTTPIVPVKTPVIAIAEKKQKKMRPDLIQKQLLADLKQQTQKQKKIKQQDVESAFAKEINEIKAKSLQQQMLQEQKRLAAVMTQQTRGIVDKYKALVLQAISQRWIIPSNVDKHLMAKLLVRVAPGGLVLDVQLIVSSGDEALDRSARAAVFKASPLPVPTDMEAFKSFKQFVLKVKPENVLTSDNIV